MAIIAKQKYAQEKIDKLHDYLKIYRDKGMPIDFEVLVDGFKAVRRTSDPDMFPMFESFVTPESQNLEVLFYTGSSNNNDKHIFVFGDEPKEQGLSGIEIDNRIHEGIEREKRNWEHESLKKENKQLREEIAELEEDIEKLEKEREESLSQQSPLKNLLGEVGSSFVESFIRRNPRLISNLPGGHALAGLLENETGTEDIKPIESEVTFEPKDKQALSQEEERAIVFVEQLKASFTKSEFDQVMEILQMLALDKEQIKHVVDYLTEKTNGQI